MVQSGAVYSVQIYGHNIFFSNTGFYYTNYLELLSIHAKFFCAVLFLFSN